MKLKTLLKSTLTALMLVMGVTSVSAQVLLEENFDYTVGTTLLSNGYTEQGGPSTTNAISAVSGNLTYTGYASSNIGNMASLASSGQDIFKGFTPQSSGIIYAAALINLTGANLVGDYFFSLKDNGGSFVGKVWAKKDASNKIAFGVSKVTTTAANISYSGFTYDLNTTYLVVVKYSIVSGLANDIVDLFVSPTVGAVEPTATITATDVTSTDAVTSLNAIILRQGNASNAPTLNIDGIRVATTWDEAVKTDIDATAPVATFAPTTGSTGVLTSSPITITFNEHIFNNADGSEITDPKSLITLTKTDASGEAVPFGAEIDATKKVITITPSPILSGGQLYYVAIAPVKDAAGNATATLSATFTTAVTLSKETDITGFTVAGVAGTLDPAGHTVNVKLPYGTNVTALTPTITISGGASINPANGAAQDFTNPVTYTVTAEDPSATQAWTVTVTFDAPLFTAKYPKSANIGAEQFDVVVNLVNAAKVYFLKVASGAAAPTSADIKTNGTVITAAVAATDYSSTITGLTKSTTYDIYFVTENNEGTILMDTPVKLSVTTSAGLLTIYDIQYTADASGDSPRKDQIVTFSGIVTAIKLNASNLPIGFYAQDGNGEWNGVNVYSTATGYTFPANLSKGDNVTVTGTVAEYNGLTEIKSVTNVTINSSSNALPVSSIISAANANTEAYEGVLVTVKNAKCTSGSAGTFVLNDGTADITAYKSLYAGLTLSINSNYDITGVMDYFGTGSKYEILPRDASDVVLLTGINDNDAVSTKVYPNPFSSDFRINAGKVVRNVTVSNMLGQKVMENAYNEADVKVPASDLKTGVYIVTVKFEDGTSTALRMVKK